MYPDPDYSQVPANWQTRMKVIHSLPASIQLDTIQDELYKQGFAIIPCAITNMSSLYIPKQTPAQPPTPIPTPPPKKKSHCTIQ